jgi:hypothetical protein
LASKTSSDKIFLKKRLPEVEKTASGRRLLAVLDVVLYHGPEASGVGRLGQIAGQIGGVFQGADGAFTEIYKAF